MITSTILYFIHILFSILTFVFLVFDFLSWDFLLRFFFSIESQKIVATKHPLKFVMENAPRRGRAPWPKKPSILIIFLNLHVFQLSITVLKMKFSIKNFFSKCDQIRRKLRIWSHLLKKSLTENFVFCAVILINLAKFYQNVSDIFLNIFDWLLLKIYIFPKRQKHAQSQQ